MNLYDFQSEVRCAHEEFATELGRLFRLAQEHLDAAHAAMQERVGRAKAELFGEPTETMAEPRSEVVLESYRRQRDV